ncbi:MAG: periplasmic heavy metal sensor [Acidobacteria bacterium]|jgi:Spy/CpxP family protein refolding chaperone|nr:periplasmic heavy metal sensor [Acidobacteriota bacterium]MCU0254804.1 periplasmic heavy metal sensor [Acidobacteriota bacterium]
MSGKRRAVLIISIVAGAALLAGVAGAVAGPGPGGGPGGDRGFGAGGPGGGPFGIGRATRELNLTVAQREQLRTIFEQQWQAGLQAAVDAARDAHDALRAAIQNPAATEEQLRAAVQATAIPDANLAVAHHRLYLAARAILTAEQQTLLSQLQAERNERRERRHDAVGAWLGGPPRDED